MGNLISSLVSGNSPSGTLEQQAEYHRNKADEYAQQHRQLSSQSQAAYKAGRGDLAKSLSIQAKAIHSKVEHHNKEAARLYFDLNNEGKPEGTIDLHGLFVKEALQRLDEAVKSAVKERNPELVVIVGAGNHSEGGIQRIRPAVEKWLRERNYTWTVMNQGCLRVNLSKKKSCCVIM